MERVALAVAATLAGALARRVPSPRQRAIAATLAGLFAVDVCRPYLPWLTLRTAAFVTWYAATSWCVFVVLEKDEPQRPVIGLRSLQNLRLTSVGTAVSFALAVLAILTASILSAERAATMGLCRVVFAISIAAQALATLRFFSRGHTPDDAQRVALILAASSVVDAVPGPWLLGEPARDWVVGRCISIATWIAVAGWETRCLIRARTRRE